MGLDFVCAIALFAEILSFSIWAYCLGVIFSTIFAFAVALVFAVFTGWGFLNLGFGLDGPATETRTGERERGTSGDGEGEDGT